MKLHPRPQVLVLRDTLQRTDIPEDNNASAAHLTKNVATHQKMSLQIKKCRGPLKYVAAQQKVTLKNFTDFLENFQAAW